VQERPDPELGPDEVRIDVAASGINFADVMARMGLYADAPKPPCVIGYEVAGTILELGANVTALSPGQRVLAGTKFGGYASQVTVPAVDVTPLPEGLSFEQGAAIPVNYGTAWAALIGYGALQPGERVLIHSAGGGVGIAATQIAKRFGAEVYGTASPSKHERIRELGVDHALDYTSEGWERGLPKFDVILDAVGGKSFKRSNLVTALRAVAQMPRFNMIKQMSESKAVIGLNMLTLWKDRQTLQPWSEPLRALLDDGTVAPVVAGTFSFEDAGAAQTMITERRNLGKVVLVP
jgi:NADPH:quinone reductase-like Zn-dependent oxidoreductase